MNIGSAGLRRDCGSMGGVPQGVATVHDWGDCVGTVLILNSEFVGSLLRSLSGVLLSCNFWRISAEMCNCLEGGLNLYSAKGSSSVHAVDRGWLWGLGTDKLIVSRGNMYIKKYLRPLWRFQLPIVLDPQRQLPFVVRCAAGSQSVYRLMTNWELNTRPHVHPEYPLYCHT